MIDAIKIELITENNQKTYRLSGIFSEAEKRNRNGRIYPKDVLRESVKELILEMKVKTIYCYLEHPTHDQIIKEDSCAVLESLAWNEAEGRAYCSVKALTDTRDGMKLIQDLDNGGSIGISTRAIGALNEEKVVQPGLKIITGDLVSTPSCQVCDLSLNESMNNTLSDFLLEAKDCGCTYKKLTISEQIEVKQHFINKITKIFEGK